jgi:hypothetical protein
MRKQIIPSTSPTATLEPDELDIDALAIVRVTSELPEHPIENAFDGKHGPGATRWVSEIGGEQTLVLAFDAPQTIHALDLEIEETQESRTQELQLALSDNGKTYREIVRQEFNFAPAGSTFEREHWKIDAKNVTHVRLQIKPDKSGRPARASITSLTLY